MDSMDQATMQNKKLDPTLRSLMNNVASDEPLQVIVKTVDGLKDDDRRTVSGLGGTVKDDLYIINAFSADLSPKAIEMLMLSPRVEKIFSDAAVHSQG